MLPPAGWRMLAVRATHSSHHMNRSGPCQGRRYPGRRRAGAGMKTRARHTPGLASAGARSGRGAGIAHRQVKAWIGCVALAANRGYLAVVFAGGLSPRTGPGAVATSLPPTASHTVDCAAEIKPLREYPGYGCHGPDRQENGLWWDVKASARQGGQSGPAPVPGHSAESRMMHLVSGREKDRVMPKQGARRTAEQIGLPRAGIDRDAAWPEKVARSEPAGHLDRSNSWSIEPAILPAIPSIDPDLALRIPGTC